VKAKVLTISIETEDTSYEADGYRIMAEVYEIMGRADLSLRYLKKQLVLGDTLWQEANQEEVTDLNIKYATNQKEKENILLKLNLERQKRAQYMWVSSLSFLLIFAVVMGYGFWQRSKNLRIQRLVADKEKQIFEKENIILLQLREQQEIKNKALNYEILAQQEINKLEQEKLQESIDSKSRALATLAMAMVQKNSILQELKEKINENSKSKASFEAKIKDILSNINNSMDMEEEWKTFKQHFEDVHPDFFVRLNKLCPDLTPHEIRFCTYIKMNISAKDIAQMMNVTNRAIQMNRHRIKKKFGLDEEVDFISFVRNI
jgi:DNA-binding CsgD family transcriptional regulator